MNHLAIYCGMELAMKLDPEFTTNLSHLGLIKDGGWDPDLAEALGQDYFEDMKSGLRLVDPAIGQNGTSPAGNEIFLMVKDPSALDSQEIFQLSHNILEVMPSKNHICIFETANPDRERCFQFEDDLAFVFVSKNSLMYPYSSFVHEFVHATGLTGIAPVDEGLATMFQNGLSELGFKPKEPIKFDRSWLGSSANFPVTSENPYLYGAKYFSILCLEKGEKELPKERERLEKMGEEKCVAEMDARIAKHTAALKTVRESKTVTEDQVNFDIPLEQLYFAASPKSTQQFAFRVKDMYDKMQIAEFSESDGLNFARLLIILSTREPEQFSKMRREIQSQGYNSLSSDAQTLIEIADATHSVQTSNTIEDLRKSSDNLLEILAGNLANEKIKADVLLSLMLFHKFLPSIAGAQREKVKEYMGLFSKLQGMEQYSNELKKFWKL